MMQRDFFPVVNRNCCRYTLAVTTLNEEPYRYEDIV
jgi:hypothetical protein